MFCKLLCRLFVFFLSFSLFGICPEELKSQVIVESTVEWKTPSSSIMTNYPYSPLWNYNGSTYYVWVDANYRAWVTKITNKIAKTVPLDPNTDYKVQPDGHNRFSMGIDTDGYIHITGDMHNYNYQTTGNQRPYPTRYQKQPILYWKSKVKESVEGGFAFVGGGKPQETNIDGYIIVSGVVNSQSIPGSCWSYGHFITDNNGVLYYASRVRAIEGGHYPGEMGIGFYKYDTSSKTWTALGGYADKIRKGKYYKILFWENSGEAPDKWYQGYFTSFHFDSANRLHFSAGVNTDTSFPGNNRLVYAMSKDGGSTWSKASGAAIPGLPLRGADGKPNQADIVASAKSGTTFGNQASALADKNGTIQAAIDGKWYIWNGKNWSLKPVNTSIGQPANVDVYNDNNNELVYIHTDECKILRSTDFNSPNYGHDLFGYNRYYALDFYGLQKTGEVYGIALNNEKKTESIVKTVYKSALLPCGWDHKDIAVVPPTYYSYAGYASGKFVSTNYGIVIDGTSDSFHYIYKEFKGDGTITAYVNTPRNSRAGVMIREDLSADSKRIAVLLTAGKIIYNSRLNKAEAAKSVNVLNTQTPYWLRLIKKGNTVAGFTSANGSDWKQIAQSSISFSDSIYIGLSAASYRHGSYMEEPSTFENVQITN